MKMRSLTVILGAITAFAVSACSSSGTSSGAGGETSTGTASATSSGTGGAGGEASTTASSTTSTTTTTSTTSTTTGTTTTTSTGSGMCDPAYTCVEAITPMSGDPAMLCAGTAKTNYDALAACTCTGACAAACKDNECNQLEPSTACKTCLVTPTTGCKTQYDACTSS
jgi:hypothetical protein